MQPTFVLREKAYELSVRVAVGRGAVGRISADHLDLRIDPTRLGIGDEELELPVRVVPARTTLRFEDDGIEVVLPKDLRHRDRNGELGPALRSFGF